MKKLVLSMILPVVYVGIIAVSPVRVVHPTIDSVTPDTGTESSPMDVTVS